MSRFIVADVEVHLDLEVVQRIYSDEENYEAFKRLITENLAKIIQNLETENTRRLSVAVKAVKNTVVFK